MQSWRDFAATYFGFRPSLAQLIWTALIMAAGRVALWMWNAAPPRSESIYWIIGFPIALIVLSAFSQVIRNSERPKLIASIDRLHIVPAGQITHDPEYSRRIGILMIVGLRNIGTPSIAENWKLSVIVAGSKQRIETKGVNLPANAAISVHDVVTGKAVVYAGADALYNKTVFTPIPAGSLVRGVLLFLIDGATEAVLTSPGTRYHLDFADVLEKSYSVVFTWPAVINRDTGYIAGLAQVFSIQPTLPLGPEVKSQNSKDS